MLAKPLILLFSTVVPNAPYPELVLCYLRHRSFEFGDRDDTRQYGNHHFCCQLNQRHLELIPTFLSQLTSLDILVHPVDSDDIEDFIEMETLADSCHNIRRLREHFL